MDKYGVHEDFLPCITHAMSWRMNFGGSAPWTEKEIYKEPMKWHDFPKIIRRKIHPFESLFAPAFVFQSTLTLNFT